MEVPNVAAVLAQAADAKLVLTLARCEPGTRPLAIEAAIEVADASGVTIGRPTYKPGQRSLVPGESVPWNAISTPARSWPHWSPICSMRSICSGRSYAGPVSTDPSSRRREADCPTGIAFGVSRAKLA